MELLEQFALTIGGTAFGILLALCIERQRRCQITFKIGEPNAIPPRDPLRREEYTWLSAEVHNPDTPTWINWVYSRDTATSCYASVMFYRLNGTRLFDHSMTPPWAEVTEPYVSENEKIVVAQTHVDIEPGGKHVFHFVGRSRSDNASYGWTTQAYLKGNWHDSKWKLEPGRCIVLVQANTQGRRFQEAFVIVNDGNYEDFKLEIPNKAIRRLFGIKK